MEPVLIGVPYTMVETVWPHIEPYVLKALRYADGKLDLAYLKQAILKRDMQLWIALQGVNILSYAITCLANYPTHRRLTIVSMGGTQLKKWRHLGKELGEWARQQNCTAIEAFGRPGWERIFADWGIKKVNTIYRLDL